MGRCHLHKKELAGKVIQVEWRAGSNNFFVPSHTFGVAQTVPASHFLNPGSSPGQAAIYSEAGSLKFDHNIK